MPRKTRNAERVKRSDRSSRTPDIGRYLIYTDAKGTEQNYLNGLRNSLPEEQKDRIVFDIYRSNTNELVESCLNRSSLYPQYAESWIILDRDEVKDFDDIIREAQNKGINVGWSNPCIEVWFDAYFGQMKNCFEAKEYCRQFSNTFKRKTNKVYSKTDKRIYTLLYTCGDEHKAILRAEQILKNNYDAEISTPSKMIPATTMHLLIREIREKTNTLG